MTTSITHPAASGFRFKRWHVQCCMQSFHLLSISAAILRYAAQGMPSCTAVHVSSTMINSMRATQDNLPHCLQVLHSQPSWLHKQPQQQQSLPNPLTEWGSQKPLTSCNRPLAFAQFILFARILQQCRRTLDSDIRDLSPAQRAAVAAGCHAHLMPHTRARGTP